MYGLAFLLLALVNIMEMIISANEEDRAGTEGPETFFFWIVTRLFGVNTLLFILWYSS